MVHHVPVFHRLVVGAKRHDTDDSTVLTFQVPPELNDEYRFVAGQHISVRAEIDGEEIRRSYSLCTPVGGPVQIGIRRDPQGRMSRWLHDTVVVGDEIDVMTPAGSFSPGPNPNGAARHCVAVAAGSGITPVISIVATILDSEPESTVSLLYVNRTHASTMFVESLEALKNRHLRRFRLTHLFTKDPGPSELLSGRIDEDSLDLLLGARVLPPDADSYFVCGPEALTEMVLGGLGQVGVAADHLHSELFGTPGVRASPSTVADAGGSIECSIRLNGRVSNITMSATDTVLDAVRRHRPEVPYSCTAGACSTCRAKLVEGSVEMEVCYGLEPDEVAAGYVLTCQARPTTDAITIDYDG